jgi:nucleotide-binding universal stress UspA family protein
VEETTRRYGVKRRWPVISGSATLFGDRKEKEMAGTIICGVDGSLDSRAALGVAAALAERLGSRLILAHAVEYAKVPYDVAASLGGLAPQVNIGALDDSEEEAGERLLEQIAFDSGLARAERRVAIGNPAERLADLADEERGELIVVGSRGRGAFKAAFLGSVSNSLVGVARCPVLIVPPGAAAA